MRLIWLKKKTWRGKCNGHHLLSKQLYVLCLPPRSLHCEADLCGLQWAPLLYGFQMDIVHGNLDRPTEESERSEYWFPSLYPSEAASHWLHLSIQGHSASQDSSPYPSLFFQVPAATSFPHPLGWDSNNPTAMSTGHYTLPVVSLNLTSP